MYTNQKLEEFKQNIKGKYVAIMGMGVSNTPLIKYLLDLDVNITVFDKKTEEELGKALIEERKIGTDEVIRFEVSGEKIQAVHMIPGYTHNIINLSDKEDLITLMWANEIFDKEHPDTFGEEVAK